MVVAERGHDSFVIDVAKHGGKAEIALKHLQQSPEAAGVPAEDVAKLTTMEASGGLTATQAKQVLADMVEAGGGDAEAIAADKGFEAMNNSELESMVDAAIAAQPGAWEKFCAGEGKAMGALVGAVMKASKGQADGKVVTALLNAKKS
jgi:aspartyl-tRNA(Asn)/glutamyl-tRNA(Gln) amidotransferase subunit B